MYTRRFLGSAALAGLAATQARAQAQTTIDVQYCFPAFARFHEAVAADFMKLHPDIKVTFRAPAPTYDDGHQSMLRAAVTNQLPDVYYSGFHLQSELVRTLLRRQQIVDLGPLLDAEPKEWVAANYSPRIINLGRVDGKLYGMAVNASTPLMYFNAELVRQAGGDPEKMPDSWDGVIALAAKIKASGPNLAGLAYNIHEWPDDWLFRALIHQGGGNMLNEAGTAVAFGDAAGQRAMRYVRRFVAEAGMPLIDWDQSRQQFIAGQIGIFFDTPARLRQVTDLIGRRFTLGTATFPVDDKAKGGLPTGGNAAIIMSRDAAKRRAAWEFVKYMTGPEAQKLVVETSGYLPTNLRAVGSDFLGPYYDANPNFRTITRQMERSVPWQGYPGGNSVRIWRMQREIINRVMRGEVAPDAGLERLVKETTALMS
ncbi:ABC transporter substrate-binding protein [Roseomonas xinghualingensis]|uniref:ABC transporter substrate-binding protein n=1 Tax=Roseomonas xinghualingensis TaxID=2986475 RepID=UPI0021F0B460|nr:ABC transporter substrate-binding protein [Roseomonas sp. SXEYE001]MCV4209540.1 ABC transporter substrate-binding protein [Roseomonas sp. SXEYE001]